MRRGLQAQNVVSWIKINRLRATGLWDFASCGVSEVGTGQPPFVWLHTVGIFGGRSGKYFVSCSSYPGTRLTKVLHLKLFDRYPIFRIPSPTPELRTDASSTSHQKLLSIFHFLSLRLQRQCRNPVLHLVLSVMPAAGDGSISGGYAGPCCGCGANAKLSSKGGNNFKM